MDEFGFYFNQGISHITDIQAIDHMLFVITLCAVYRLDQWRNILLLITAFTIGHSITLALSSLDVIRVNQQLVETLIPITILLTSIYNIFQKNGTSRTISYNYLLALFFGLIHGMGFSNFFRTMMMGIDDSIAAPLLAFNLGIEVGQLIIVSCFMFLLFVFTNLKGKHREWNLYISGAGAGLAINMIIQALH